MSSHEPERDDGERGDGECPVEALAELRALYARLRPAEPADDAADADPLTADTVAWLRAAWTSIEPPAVVLPFAHRARARRRRLVLLAAAAAAVLLLAAGRLLRRGPWPAEPAETSVARGEADPGTPSTPGHGRSDSGDAPDEDDAVEIVDVRPDQLELRSGPVRLLLLAPTPLTTTEER